METKNSKGLIFLVVVLLIATLGLGGYIVCDKMIKKDTSTEIETNNEKVEGTQNMAEEKEEQVQNVEKTRTTQVLHGVKGGDFIVSKDGNVYFIPSDKQKNAAEISQIGTYGEYEVDDYITGLGWDETSQKTTEDHKFNGYKLNLENVVSVYNVDIGQTGDYQTFLFVEEDGTVDMLAFQLYAETKTVFEKNVSEHPNIVSVTQSAGFGAYIAQFIDKDGNSYNFDNYKYFHN